jgi:hypothetical protein
MFSAKYLVPLASTKESFVMALRDISNSIIWTSVGAISPLSTAQPFEETYWWTSIVQIHSPRPNGKAYRQESLLSRQHTATLSPFCKSPF